MLENATQICGASFGGLLLCEGEVFRRVALYNASPPPGVCWIRQQDRRAQVANEVRLQKFGNLEVVRRIDALFEIDRAVVDGLWRDTAQRGFFGESGYNQRARSLARRETEWHIGPYGVQKFHGLDCQWLT